MLFPEMETLVERVDILSKKIIDPKAPFLGKSEAEAAVAALSKPVFSQVVRSKADPKIAGQEIGLFSFTPSNHAKPDKYGIYGTLKLRGNYANEKDAAVAAERIVRSVDSINEIYHVRVGETVPLTKETKWTADFDSVDLKKRMDEIESFKRRSAEEEEKREREEILQREKKILDQNKEIVDGTYKENPLDHYTMLCVARAQLMWTKADTERKLNEEVIPAIERRVKEIQKMDAEFPEFKKQFLKKYMDARKEACLNCEIPEDHEKVQQGFLKYLVEDA